VLTSAFPWNTSLIDAGIAFTGVSDEWLVRASVLVRVESKP
jgi:hypothetical protein